MFGYTVKRRSKAPIVSRKKTKYPISDDLALTLSAIYCATHRIASTFATIPLHVKLRTKNKVINVDRHPLERLLNRRPNEFQTASGMRYSLMRDLLFFGEGYCYKSYDQAGRLVGLQYLPYNSVQPYIHEGRMYFRFLGLGGIKIFNSSEVWYTFVKSKDGFRGSGILNYISTTMNLSLRLEDFADDKFAEGLMLAGFVKHPQRLEPEEIERLTTQYNEMFSGNQGIGLLEDGTEFVPSQSSPEAGQMIESRKFQIEEIARYYSVPPQLLYTLEGTAWTSLEQLYNDFIKSTMHYWLTEFKQSIESSLLDATEQSLTIFFDITHLLAANLSDLVAYWNAGKLNGWLNSDEIRDRQGFDPLPNGQGQGYTILANMIDSNNSVPSNEVNTDAESDS